MTQQNQSKCCFVPLAVWGHATSTVSVIFEIFRKIEQKKLFSCTIIILHRTIGYSSVLKNKMNGIRRFISKAEPPGTIPRTPKGRTTNVKVVI